MAQATLDRANSKNLAPLERVQTMVRDPQPVTVIAKADQAKAVQAKLFGIEQQARQELEQIIQTEEAQRRQVEINRFAAQKQVGIVDNSVLDWRDKDGMPLLVPFSLKSPEFSIHDNRRVPLDSGVKWGQDLVPSFIGQHYHDVLNKLHQPIDGHFFGYPVNWSEAPCSFYSALSAVVSLFSFGVWLSIAVTKGISAGMSLLLVLTALVMVMAIQLFMLSGETKYASRKTTVFGGMIPDDARELISSKVADFDGIIILAEAKSWITEVTVLSRVDPLILGYKYDQLFYLGKFDPVSPTESFVAQEFVIKPS